MIQYVATEYGVVNLTGLSLLERAQATASIAHPSFREELLPLRWRTFWDQIGSLPSRSLSLLPFSSLFSSEKLQSTDL